MEKALTIIIPAYNVSQYIDQGVQSLLEDKTLLPWLDIIIINDGSKDDTLEKALLYAHQYHDCVSVIDKENGGHGSGINVGIKAAKGKYLKVLDGDDWVKPDGLNELVEYIINTKDDPDAIINPFEKVWENGKREVVRFSEIPIKKTVTFAEVNNFEYTLPLHALTLRRRMYEEYDIPDVDERISYDDMEYILYPIPYIKRIVFLKSVVYEYRLGLLGQSMNRKQMIKKLPMHTKVIDSLAEYYNNHLGSFQDENRKYYEKEFVNTLATNCELRIINDESKEDLRSYINQYSYFPLSKMRNKKIKLLILSRYLAYSLVRSYILRAEI